MIVALLIDTSMAFGRALIRGVSRYAQQADDWQVYLEPRHAEMPASLTAWQVDGVIARVRNAAAMQVLAQLHVPKIIFNPYSLPVPQEMFMSPWAVEPMIDNASAGVAGAQHLLERGFRQLAFCGLPGVGALGRDESFCLTATEAAATCHRYAHGEVSEVQDYAVQQAHLSRWLNTLPKPIGVMATNDMQGRRVIEACHRMGLRVPLDVAVLGVDNDELFCSVCKPQLSSVAFSVEHVGYSAAHMLDNLRQGRKAIPPPAVLASGVVTRASTDTIAVADPLVSGAIGYIRSRALSQLSVDDVVRELATSRRTLEMRMQAALGVSPSEEIQRVRMERARQLLRDTELPLFDLAERCGYRNATRFAEAFKRIMGMPPIVYRRRYRFNH